MFFFVGRNDCKRFRPAEEVDIAYTKALRRVAGRVELLAYRFRFSPGKVSLAEKLPIDL
jgi:DNA-binding sugar fermentation-stimulating protein